MKTIKKIIGIAAGIVGALLLIVGVSSKRNKKKIKEVKKKIKDNKEDTKEVDKKILDAKAKVINAKDLIDITDKEFEKLKTDLEYIKDPKKSLDKLKNRAKRSK